MKIEPISVTELNRYMKDKVAEDEYLKSVFVRGEISNFKNHYASGHLYFTLKDNEEIGAIRKGKLEMYFGDDVYFVDENKIEQHLELYAFDYPDADDYDGCVSYTQYNPKNDTCCEIRYQHMYREMNGRPIIYSYHTKTIDCLYINDTHPYSSPGAYVWRTFTGGHPQPTPTPTGKKYGFKWVLYANKLRDRNVT